jgi:hypothetical protein
MQPMAEPIEGGDMLTYIRLARNLLAGHGLSSASNPPYRFNSYSPPGYPAFLAAIFALTGRYDTAVHLSQAFMELGVVLLMAPLGRTLGLAPPAAAIGGLLMWWHPFLVAWTVRYYAESLACVVVMVFLLIAGTAMRARKTRRPAYLAAAGALAALCAMVRSDTYLQGALVCASVLLALREESMPRRLVVLGPICALGFTITFAPWVLYWRSHSVDGGWVPAASNYSQVQTGYMYWLNTWFDNPRYLDPYGFQRGNPAGPRQFPADKIPDAEERREAEMLLARMKAIRSYEGGVAEGFAALAKRARERIGWRGVVAVAFRRLITTWATIPSLGYLPHRFYDTERLVLYVVWLPTLVIAALGSTAAVLQRRYELYPLIVLVLSRGLLPLMSAAGTEQRYLLQGLPAVYLLAGYGAWELWKRLPRQRPSIEVA